MDGAAFPAAMVTLPDGSLLYGERLNGVVRRISPAGTLMPEPVASMPVATNGEQRGLIGLAVDADGGLFASFTRPDGRLVVQETGGTKVPGRLVWEGPISQDRANGGHIAFAPDGSLVIGVGDLLDPEAAADPSTPNGKLLALDPRGPPDQIPGVISSGWNNPFAFSYAPDGTLYVADNTGGEEGERLAIGNAGPRPVVLATFPPHTVPSGLAALSDGRLAICSYLRRTLTIWSPRAQVGETSWGPGLPIETDCSLAVVAMGDGTIRYANESQVLASLSSP